MGQPPNPTNSIDPLNVDTNGGRPASTQAAPSAAGILPDPCTSGILPEPCTSGILPDPCTSGILPEPCTSGILPDPTHPPEARPCP